MWYNLYVKICVRICERCETALGLFVLFFKQHNVMLKKRQIHETNAGCKVKRIDRSERVAV